jgi:hypothetical protein
MVSPELWTLQLSPLYHREEGSRKKVEIEKLKIMYYGTVIVSGQP